MKNFMRISFFDLYQLGKAIGIMFLCTKAARAGRFCSKEAENPIEDFKIGHTTMSET